MKAPANTTNSQHMKALEKANEVRLARAELKRRINAGFMHADEVVLDPPPEAETMQLMELLCAQHRWGRERSRRVFLRLGVPENKKLGTMTPRQSRHLAELIQEKKNGS